MYSTYTYKEFFIIDFCVTKVFFHFPLFKEVPRLTLYLIILYTTVVKYNNISLGQKFSRYRKSKTKNNVIIRLATL